MKKLACVISGVLLISMMVAGCSSSKSDGPIQISLSKDGVAAMEVIQGYWAAFNNYDLDTAVTYLDPTYALTRAAGVKRDLDSFQAGKGLHVQMVVYSVAEAGVLSDGRLDLRVTMKVTPAGLGSDNYLRYYMTKESDGSWKISRVGTDYDKTVPGGPINLALVTVTASQVDIQWQDKSSHETGYRVERALDTKFTTGLVSFQLPANTTAYSDTTVVPGASYYYRVFAFNNAGDSQPSARIPVVVPASSS